MSGTLSSQGHLVPSRPPPQCSHNADVEVARLVGGQQVVERLDRVGQLALAQVGDGLHQHGALAVLGQRLHRRVHAPLRQAQLARQRLQVAARVKVAAAVAQHLGQLRAHRCSHSQHIRFDGALHNGSYSSLAAFKGTKRPQAEPIILQQ